MTQPSPFPTRTPPTLADVLHFAASVARLRRADFATGADYHAARDRVAADKREAQRLASRVLVARGAAPSARLTLAQWYDAAAAVPAVLAREAPPRDALAVLHTRQGYAVVFAAHDVPAVAVWAAVGHWLRRHYPEATGPGAR